MKDTKTKEKFIELRAQGLSYQKIATQLQISKQTAINFARELHYEISNLKALELDALYQKHFLTTRARLELFSEQLANIRKEVNKRSLVSVPTERLFDLYFKLLMSMNEEKERLIIKSMEDVFNGPTAPQEVNIELA